VSRSKLIIEHLVSGHGPSGGGLTVARHIALQNAEGLAVQEFAAVRELPVRHADHSDVRRLIDAGVL
jgi:hypothetical protein